MYGQYAPFYRGGFFNPMQTPTMPNVTENQNQWQLQNMQQPLNQPMQNNPVTMPQTPMSDMIWVLGQTEAESYLVAPNNSVVLWDKSNPTIYVKSVNAQGVPSMRILDFSERAQNAPQTPTEHVCKCGDNFVTKDDFNALKGDFEAFTQKFEETAITQVTKPNKTTKKGE
jgi:hypothetical protein